MRIPQNPLIKWSSLRGPRVQNRFSGEIVTAYLGRYALHRVLEMLEIKPHEEILVPRYHCVAMIEPILRYGCGISLYRVKMGLQTTIEDIRKAVRKGTRGVALIHYFGLPQRGLEEIKEYLEGRGIFLIEDCAHVIPREDDIVGSVGDVSIYTPRKFLPVPDGAIIRVNNPRLMNRIQNKPLPLYNELKTIKNICEQRLMAGEENGFKRWYMRIDSGVNRIRNGGARSESRESRVPGVEFDPKLRDAKCSLAAQYMMTTADFEGIYRKRIEIFEYLFEVVYGRHLMELPEFLDRGNRRCTFGFPVLSDDRKSVVRILKSRGVETFTFGDPLYRAEEVREDSEEIKLSQKLFFAPINQDFNSNQLKYLSECLKEVITKRQARPGASV